MKATGITSARARFVVFVLFVLGTAAVAIFVLGQLKWKPDEIRAAVAEWRTLAPLVFIALFALRPFVFFPSTVLFIAAGLAFGPLFGTLYSVLGGAAAALITFGLARALGRDFVQGRLPPRLAQLQREQWGTGLVFLLNLVPLVPITAVNYTAGLSKMSLHGYLLAVVAGLAPRAFAYCFFGDSLINLRSFRVVLALALLGGMVLVPALLFRYFSSRQTQAAGPSES